MIRANLKTASGIDISEYSVVGANGTGGGSYSISTPAVADDIIIVSSDGASTTLSGVTAELVESCTGTSGSCEIYLVTVGGTVSFTATSAGSHTSVLLCRKSTTP